MELLKYINNLNKYKTNPPAKVEEVINDHIKMFAKQLGRYPTVIRISKKMFQQLTREAFPSAASLFGQDMIQNGVRYHGIKVIAMDFKDPNKISIH
jgi:hypothetical protein